MQILKICNVQGNSKVRLIILLVFILIFILPAFLTPPWLIFKRIFPNKKQQEAIIRLDDIKDPISALQQFSVHSWFNRTFQDRFSEYFNETFAMRKLFIRFNNQLYYTLFDKSYMNHQDIIGGKDKYLYERSYIDDYCGISAPMSPDKAEALARELLDVQTSFKKLGVTFFVFITPGKATIYPEYIPDAFMKRRSGTLRNYENMVHLFREYKIDFIDGPQILLKAKEKTGLPLFCRGSSHWNYLGALLAAKQIIEEIESLKGKTLAHLSCEEIKVENKPRGSDRDLASLLYTVFPPYDYPTAHPVITSDSNGHVFKGDIVFVGGSFNAIILD